MPHGARPEPGVPRGRPRECEGGGRGLGAVPTQALASAAGPCEGLLGPDAGVALSWTQVAGPLSSRPPRPTQAAVAGPGARGAHDAAGVGGGRGGTFGTSWWGSPGLASGAAAPAASTAARGGPGLRGGPFRTSPGCSPARPGARRAAVPDSNAFEASSLSCRLESTSSLTPFFLLPMGPHQGPDRNQGARPRGPKPGGGPRPQASVTP